MDINNSPNSIPVSTPPLPTPNYTQVPKSHSLPSFTSLLTESWHTFEKSIFPMFGLNILAFLFGIVIMLLCGGGVVALAFSTGIFSALKNPNDTAAILKIVSTIKPITFIAFGLLFFVFNIVAWISGMVVQIASVFIVADSKLTPASIGASIKKSFPYIIPLIVVGIIGGLLSLGSFFVFILPFLFVSYFFMYTSYEVILSGKKGVDALRGSAQIISQFFGEILVRNLAIMVVYILLFVFVPNLITKIDSQTGKTLSILSFFVPYLFGWFALSYSVTLYKQAKETVDTSKKQSILWVVVLAVVGLLIFLGIMYLSFVSLNDYLKKNPLQKIMADALSKSETQTTEPAYSYAPSSCGLSIPILKTTDTTGDKTRKWYFEEKSLTNTAFFVLDTDIVPIKNVLVSLMAYRDAPLTAVNGIYSLSDPGLYIKCIDNTKGYTLEEYTSLVQTNKTYTIKIGKKFHMGEVPLTQITASGKMNGKDFMQNGYIGISKDGAKLYFVNIWFPPETDTNKKNIDPDFISLLGNVKYRDAKVKIDDIVIDESATKTQQTTQTTTNTQPACNRYTIREGEFASDKCYSQKDYADLQYYAQRFDSAVFTYNGAISSMRITCDGSAFFKASCDRQTAEKKQAEDDMNKYRDIIKGIISRGW